MTSKHTAEKALDEVEAERESPRRSVAAALKAFMAMPESEWTGLAASLAGGGVLTPTEDKAYRQALTKRGAPTNEAASVAGDRPSFIKEKSEREADAGASDSERAKELRRLKDLKEDLEGQLKAVNTQIDGVSIALAESMEAHGVDSFKVTGVGSVYLQIINRPRVVDADKFIAWLDETGQGAMAPRSVHWKRLESMVKEMLGSAQALPSSIENFQQTRALIRRA